MAGNLTNICKLKCKSIDTKSIVHAEQYELFTLGKVHQELKFILC